MPQAEIWLISMSETVCSVVFSGWGSVAASSESSTKADLGAPQIGQTHLLVALKILLSLLRHHKPNCRLCICT
jgi:hypothetical protein